jgi:hypothetical protein
MMKSSKCLLLLAALVGFGLVGKSNAALLSSIEITSPDSGASVGIDSVITVTATVTDFVGVGNGGVLADSESQILMYLRTDAGPVALSTEWRISKHTETAAFSDASSDLPTFLALNAAWSDAGTADFMTTGIVGRTTPSNATTKVFYAAIKSANVGRISANTGLGVAARNDSRADSINFVGPNNAGAPRGGGLDTDIRDNVLAKTLTKNTDEYLFANTAGDVTTFTWRVKVRPGLGDLSKVYAEAIVFDDSDNSSTATKNTLAASSVNIDAVRPVNPGAYISISVTGANSGLSINAGDRAPGQNYGPIISTNWAHGATAAFTRGQLANLGLPYKIAGVGDKVTVETNLGTSTQGYASGDSLTAEMNFLGKTIALNKANRSGAVLSHVVTLSEGYLGNLSKTGDVGTVQVYYVDKAGNHSGGASGSPTHIVEGTSHAVLGILMDTNSPTLDSIKIAKGDTITDGTVNSGTYTNNMVNDTNAALFAFDEAIDSLTVSFNDPSAVTLSWLGPQALDSGMTGGLSGKQTAAAVNVTNRFNFTVIGDTDAATDEVVIGALEAIATSANGGRSSANNGKADTLTTGLYTMTIRAVDHAGNASSKAIDSIYVDPLAIELKRPFPTNLAFGATTGSKLFKNGGDSRVDTIDEATGQVVFQLSEPADSVRVIYTKISGSDTQASRARALSGTQLLNISSEQTTAVEGLTHNTVYDLHVETIDLAGNNHKYQFGQFIYDSSYVVPMIKRFTIAATSSGNTVYGSADKVAAGTAVTLTIQADASTDGTLAANAYKGNAILKVSGGGAGLTLAGTGVTDLGGGRATLTEQDWAVGSRTITLKDTIAGETLQVSIVDSTDASNPYAGSLDSSLVTENAAFDTISVNAPDTVDVGEQFWVSVTKKDVYGNVVPGIEYFSVTTNQIGIQLPVGEQQLSAGVGGFYAQANSVVGALEFKIKANVGGAKEGIDSTSVVAGSGLDAPNTLVAEDYMGADGAGDQGGFIMLTWDPSDDHGSLDGYRIYREVQVSQGKSTDADGNATIVALEAPATAMVPWASVDAVPGEEVGRAIVATLDNVATNWGVSSERGGATAGAKSVSVEAISAYEAMAFTMQQSREKVAIEGPVFATLLPEALAFAENGVAPRFNLFDTEMVRSSITETKEAVRSIDNIAPSAVPYLRVLDTPADEGNSITLTWTKSESDRMLARSASNAVSIGSVNDMVAGVVGYNIYRKVGAQGEFTMVGKAASGANSFADETALNGVRYTYSVSPYDHDNIAETSTERTAMAIRNSAVDSQGKMVQGLFGSDNTVGFDDFFIFADNFGISAADEVFEPAFDLSPNAGMPRVDFDDFFVFADNFGRSIQAAGKVVPMLAGLNSDARLYLETAADLPNVGEEVVVNVDMADFVQMKGYGFSVAFDAEQIEFVRATTTNSLLGDGEFASPRTIAQADGKVDIAAYGDVVTDGELGLSLVFRTKTEIENTEIEVTGSQVSDGSLGINAVALPAPVQIQTRPEAFALANNYPNPFNPATTIKYALPEASQVRLEVFNVVGQVVRTMVDAHQNAGRYVVQWDASNDNGVNLSSGIYFYRLQVEGSYLEVKKMLLLK